MNVHYHIHKSLLLVPLLSQLNPVLTLTPYVFDIQFNIMLPSTSECTKWPLFFRFADKLLYSLAMFVMPVVCFVHIIHFDLNGISWKVEIVNLLIMKIHRHLVNSFLLGQDNLCNDLFSYLPICVLLLGRETELHTHADNR